MKEVFVDTAFWVARLFPRDNYHKRAVEWGERCRGNRLVTTDSVLSEVSAFFAEKGSMFRQAVSELVERIENDPNIVLLPDTRDLVKEARVLYAQRLDKGYSLVDCHSMVVMTRRNIRVILTMDHHFVQAGFVALLDMDPSQAELCL